jgi:hypothetical protein
MAKLVLPRVHVMVLCDEIEPSPTEEDVFDLRGVRTYIAAPSFPYTHPQLSVYLQVTGHKGTASGWAVVSDPETDTKIYVSQQEEIVFDGPLTFITVRWRLYDCSYPEPGVYYVQVHFDGKLISERALILFQGEATASNGQQVR